MSTGLHSLSWREGAWWYWAYYKFALWHAWKNSWKVCIANLFAELQMRVYSTWLTHAYHISTLSTKLFEHSRWIYVEMIYSATEN